MKKVSCQKPVKKDSPWTLVLLWVLIDWYFGVNRWAEVSLHPGPLHHAHRLPSGAQQDCRLLFTTLILSISKAKYLREENIDDDILTHLKNYFSGVRGREEWPEPEFLNILKCNLAESVGAGFQFNCYDIFNDKKLNYRHLDHFSGLLKFTEKSLFYH